MSTNAGPSSDSNQRISGGLYAFGWLCILAGLAATGMLVFEHLVGAALPGCGPGSACSKASASVWGKVPGLGWPVSYVGLSWFIAAAAGWLVSRNGVSGFFRAIARLSAAVSLMYIAVIFININQYFCQYCLASHVANFGLLVAIELAIKAQGKSKPAMLAVGGAFIAATILLAVGNVIQRADIERRAQAQADASTQDIIEAGAEQRTAFTGRYLLGPERAAIRIVMFTDYQCPDCKRVEEEIRHILNTRDDVSLSVKHFPFNADCNPYISRSLHANACLAARIAETAGILRGAEGFYQLHFWLFDQSGNTPRDVLLPALEGMGYDIAEFERIMTSDDPLPGIHADVEEAMELGIHFTPMVFVNGIEFKGWQRPGALTNAIEQVALTNPEPMSAEEAAETPADADQKIVEDWLTRRQVDIATDSTPMQMGGENPEMDVVVWGDYQVAGFKEIDAILRRWAAADSRVRYSVRQYPINQGCNPVAQTTMNQWACVCARAIEAARLLDPDSVWAVHSRLLERDGDMSAPGALNEVVEGLPFEAGDLAPLMNDPQIVAALDEDARAAARLGIRSVPLVYVNGRHVPRHGYQGENKLHLLYQYLFGENPPE